MKPHPDILLCTIEVSRAAHRERDDAEHCYTIAHSCPRQYRTQQFANASLHSRRKNEYYALKDRGIIHLHRAGVLRYAGASPQGLAIYEYGDGGLQCLHSTLHPVGAERIPVAGHPEILQVPAKDKVRGVSLKRILLTLGALPSSTEGYERSSSPSMKAERPPVVCYECGGEGHIARDCPEGEEVLYDSADDDPPEHIRKEMCGW
ncbi:MAG: zinc finger CCHC domain-containing protein [Terriglobales bacterium]